MVGTINTEELWFNTPDTNTLCRAGGNGPDKSWDVVYSRHVVDHMASFEDALDEHCRVAKKLVIIVLWRPLGNGEEHEIKHIVDQGKVYENEYTNDYSRKKVLEALAQK